MTIRQLFAKLFGPVEREAETVAAHLAADAYLAVRLTEKEFIMAFSQAFQDAIDHIKGVNSQVADLKKQVSDRDTQISDLGTELTDAKQQISDMEAAVIAADPTVQPSL